MSPNPSPISSFPSSSTKSQFLGFHLQLTSGRDLVSMFQLIEQEACQRLNAESASVLFWDQAKHELWSPLMVKGQFLRLDARLGIAGACVAEGKMINVKDVQSDPRFYSGIDAKTRRRTRSLLAVPLIDHEGNVLGVFEALNKKKGCFSHRDERLAQDFVEQIVSPLQTTHLIQQLEEQRDQLKRENAHLWKEVGSKFSTQQLIGNSLPMQQLVRVIDQIRESSVDVLITGESGTGKELVAKAIHYNSPRARQPFVSLNCAALPDNLIESELFGIKKGTATGVEDRRGKFEEAHTGTLFLDEIGDMGLEAQAKVLRVLQEREVERVGERNPISLDLRIITATNKNLEKAIEEGTFREDLYYRIKVVHLQTPALRDCSEDIPLLAYYFLKQYQEKNSKASKRFSSKAMERLMRYPWPGNVRQLENEIKRIVVMVRQQTISEESLDINIRQPTFDPPRIHSSRCQTLPDAVKELEQSMIKQALQACRFNQVETARLLGISRQGLIKKMKRYHVQK